MNNRVPIPYLAKKTADARRVLMGTFASDLGTRIALDLMGIETPRPENTVFADIIAHTHRDTLSRSVLFLADADMVDLLDTAAPTMPDQELQPTDIIVPNGFIYLAKPLPDRSGVGIDVPIHALSWAHIPADHPLLSERTPGESVLITSYVTVRDQAQARGMLNPNEELPPNVPSYVPNATVMWTIGTLIGKAFGDIPPEGGYTPGFYQRLIAAFWTLAQQPKMTTTTHEKPGQPVDQRRNRRAGVTDPTAPVHVIRLHHTPPQQGHGATGEPGVGGKMTVRSATRGHWRNQWYPSIQSHRHIFIDPFWRGPENAPVVGGERVFLAHGTKTETPQPPKN